MEPNVMDSKKCFIVLAPQDDIEDSPPKYLMDRREEKTSTNSPTSEAQKLRFSIAHIMGFMNGGKKEAKADDDVDKKTDLTAAGCDDKIPKNGMPKLWRPTPTRDYLTTAADFSAMAILSRQYSIFGAAAATSSTPLTSSPAQWKTNFLTSAFLSSMQQEPFNGALNVASPNVSTAFARSVLQQQQLRHHAKSLFG